MEQKWLKDENWNKCLVEFFGNKEKAQKALDSLENCKNCVNCRSCRSCRNCIDCRSCSVGIRWINYYGIGAS